MKVVMIIQARMGSQRLPGKVLLPILGRSLLQWQIERMRRATLIDQIIVATSTEPDDLAIARLCEHLDVTCHRGSEQHVLSRYCEAAALAQADVVVRVTGDCPVLDPKIVDRVIQEYLDHAESVDFVSNMLVPSFPLGMATEVFSARLLEEARLNSPDPFEIEHVTPFVTRRPTVYRLRNVSMTPNLQHVRLTVDERADFALISTLVEQLHPANAHFSLSDVLHFLEANPSLATLNRHVRQKT